MATSRGFGQFSRRMEFVARGVGRRVERTVRVAALAADQAAVTETPVDVGRARAGWITSVGSPSDARREPSLAGEPGSEQRGAANAQLALDAAEPIIDGWRLGMGSIFMTNNVEYIGFLEEGSSDQAPEGMTQAAIDAARLVLRRARLLRG